MSKTIHTTPLQFITNKVDCDIQIKSSKLPNHQIFPVDKKFVMEFLCSIDKKYIYKLKCIEFKPMGSKLVSVLGSYFPVERKIILYSTYPVIVFSHESTQLAESIEKFNGFVKFEDNLYWGSFADNKLLTLWYVYYVLCHEIAHHYISINRYRRKLVQKPILNEGRAKKLAQKIYSSLF